MAQDPVIEQRVREVVARATGRDTARAPVQRLAGHASARSYWRVGGAPASRVVMVMPPGAGPEEVTKGGAPPVNPFVDVRDFLAGLGVRVPRIDRVEEDDPRGALLVLEDLGDDMLETRLRAGDPSAPLYERAVDVLARLRVHAEAAQAAGARTVALARAFDFDLFHWELQHFREWLLEAWKGVTLGADERADLDARFEALARALDAEPKGFTHRDYQSRNIMVLPGGEQAVIDFQDALLGPRQYDLVALLRDSYVDLPHDFIDRMVRRYLARLGAEGGPRLDHDAFRATFDLLTVQRKLKDAGRFVYIDRVKQNPGFLPNIPASLRYVRDALARLPALRDLQALLGRHVPELRA